MLSKPIHLISPSGKNLDIQLETHVYSEQDSTHAMEVLKDRDLFAFEGVNLSAPEKYVLNLMYVIPMGVLSLFSGKSHANSNPTLTEIALCGGLQKKVNIPLERDRVKKNVCDPLFGSHLPGLSSLKRVERLESDLSPMGRIFFAFFEARFCFIFAYLAAGAASLVFRKKQIWTFTTGKIGKVAERLLNPFAWPRYLREKRGRLFSDRVTTAFKYTEMASFYLTLGYQILYVRNEGMARRTHEIVEGYRYQKNMIVVGWLHSGIADILVERYHYRREPPN